MKFWRNVLIVAVPYGVAMLTYKFFAQDSISLTDIFWVITTALLFGLLFTYFAKFFTARQLKKIEIEMDEDETELKEAGANHMVGLEGVGGKLVLTNKRLVFKSHHLNIQTHQLDIIFAKIQSMKVSKSIGLLENVLLMTIDNQEHKFIVEDPAEWIEAISTRCASAGT
jgi:hypothetical protein